MTDRWTAELRVAYDRPETLAETIDWMVDSDPLELRDLALNLLRDVEMLKAELRKVSHG